MAVTPPISTTRPGAVPLEWALTDRVETAAGRIAVDVLGAERPGPPIVLTHGTPSWSYLWRAVAPVLAREHPVHLWDLPGYGDSTLDVAPSITVHARTLADLVAHWGLGAPVLVGHDIGAATVLRAHLVDGVAARGIVVADAAVLHPWLTGFTRHTRAHLEAYRSMPTEAFQTLVDAHVRTTTHGTMAESSLRAYVDRYPGADGQRRYLDQVAGFTEADTDDVVARLGEITAPTHVVWGAQDTWIPPAAGRTLRDAVPGAALTLVPEAGHFLTEDDGDAAAEAFRVAVADVVSRG